MRKKNILMYFVLLVSLTACGADDHSDININEIDPEMSINRFAKVVQVTFTGEENNYTFSVTIDSPDKGCDQYADWWEIISEEEELIYRRILGHSHVDEQPFIRSGGLVNITTDQIVYIRAHMNNSGYGDVVYKGSIVTGFTEHILDTNFAKELATQAPLPNGCAF